MKERKDSILLFAGTTEGRNLAEALREETFSRKHRPAG